MTQIDTLLTAKAQPSSRPVAKLAIDAQSERTDEFAQFWSTQIDAHPAKDAAPVSIADALQDADISEITNVDSPEGALAPIPVMRSKNDCLHPQATAPHAFLQSKTVPQNAQLLAPQAEPHGSQTVPVQVNRAAEETTDLALKYAPSLRMPQTPAATGAPQVTLPQPQPQPQNLQRPTLPVAEKAIIIPETVDATQPTRDTLWSVAASSSRAPITSPMPPMSAAVPTTPILATLAPPDLGVISDEPLDADQGIQSVSQGTVTTTAASSALQRTFAPQVAHQIATAIVQTSGATTEIALNPEELGRVRISLTAGDTGLTVAIIAERPETVDLMRRNIDLLTRELHEMGYENLTFTFGDQSNDAGQNQDRDDGTAQSRTTFEHSAIDEHPTTSMRVALSGGLDLKL